MVHSGPTLSHDLSKSGQEPTFSNYWKNILGTLSAIVMWSVKILGARTDNVKSSDEKIGDGTNNVELSVKN